MVHRQSYNAILAVLLAAATRAASGGGELQVEVLQWRATGAAKDLRRSSNGPPSVLQRRVAGAAKARRRSCKGASLELQATNPL